MHVSETFSGLALLPPTDPLLRLPSSWSIGTLETVGRLGSGSKRLREQMMSDASPHLTLGAVESEDSPPEPESPRRSDVSSRDGSGDEKSL